MLIGTKHKPNFINQNNTIINDNNHSNGQISHNDNDYEKDVFVTLLSTEHYLEGVVCLYKSLVKTKTRHRLIVAVTDDIYDSVSPILSMINIEHIKVNKLFYTDDINNDVRFAGKNVINTASKAEIFKLCQFKKCIFIDCDTFATKNLDFLFNYPVGAAYCEVVSDNNSSGGTRYSALSGFFSYAPSVHTYNLIKFILTTKPFCLDGEIISGLTDTYVQNQEYRYPEDVFFQITFDGASSDLENRASIMHFTNMDKKPWMMDIEKYKILESKFSCMSFYTNILGEARMHIKECKDTLLSKNNRSGT